MCKLLTMLHQFLVTGEWWNEEDLLGQLNQNQISILWWPNCCGTIKRKWMNLSCAKQMMEGNKWASWRQWNKQMLHLWPGLCLGCDLNTNICDGFLALPRRTINVYSFRRSQESCLWDVRWCLWRRVGKWVCVSGCAKEGKAYAGKVYLCPKWVTSLSSELCFVEHAGLYIYINIYVCMCVCAGAAAVTITSQPEQSRVRFADNSTSLKSYLTSNLPYARTHSYILAFASEEPLKIIKVGNWLVILFFSVITDNTKSLCSTLQ